MSIEKVQISPTGPSLSRIVAGTMTWGEWGADYDSNKMADLIGYCVDIGITTFDHADIYGHYSTEETFGQALSLLGTSVRAQMEIVTKGGILLQTKRRPDIRVHGYDLTADYLVQQAERSLKNLRTDYLDLYLVHRPSPLMEPAEIAEAFRRLEESGKVGSFGVSNFTPSQFNLVSEAATLVTNQVECHPLHTDCFYDGTFDQLLSRGVHPMIWSPIGGSKYFKGESTSILRLRDTVKTIAKKYGDVGEDVILLAWLLKHPVGAIPVVGTTKKSRLGATRLALELDLDAQDWFIILEAATGHEVA